MQSSARIIVSALVVLAVGGGAWFLTRGDGAQQRPPLQHEPAPAQPQQQPDPTTIVRTGPVQADPVPVVGEGQRTRVNSTGQVAADADQGVSGRVVLPNGGPAADVEVFLLKNAAADPLNIYIANKTGQTIEPMARTRTADDGSFRLGIAQMSEPSMKLDVRVISDHHPEFEHKGVRVRRYDWSDLGDLQLELGGLVTGYVVDERTGRPLGDATVYLTNPDQLSRMMPTPGRERGIPTLTGNDGFFRFDNAPRTGRITIGAEAQGYAYGELTNQPLQQESGTEFRLELAAGVPLGGVVVDAVGQPVRGALIRATALSAKLPQSAEATSAADGAFYFPTLRAGPYRLQVTAAGYQEQPKSPVIAPDEAVKIVMEQRGVVRLRVLAADGRPLKSYTVSLKRYFPNNPKNVGKVPEFANVRITPADYEGDYAQVVGVPHGDYKFQIIEQRHAKTLSPPFEVTSSTESPAVEVRLNMGAAITGVVVDDRGIPVAGATVASDRNGALALANAGDFGRFLSTFAPDVHTMSTTKTGDDGRFVLTKLAYSDYMVRVSHSDFCEGASLDISLETEGQVKDVGQIQLRRGALVSGVCTYAGRPAGQIRVTISAPEGSQPTTNGNGQNVVAFSATAYTDDNGRYAFAQRVPPGTHRIYANREASEKDFFGPLMDMKATERPLIVAPGQVELQQNFNIPGQ